MIHSLCVACDRRVHEGIFNDDFPLLLMKVMWPAVALVPLLIIYFRSVRRPAAGTNKTPVIIAALLIGIGLGGFIDAITLHALLQWHQMISNMVPNDTYVGKSVNMFWDGVFELTTWTATLIGVVLLWDTGKHPDLYRSNKVFWGGLLAGWGAFNLMDSVNHFILRLHNVREQVPAPDLYNWAFLLISLAFVGVGWWLMKRG
jgi:uncharacterized membrane protein